MQDGFYLSTYLDIDKLGNLCELSNRHDLNMSLWKKSGEDIELVHYWELERISGRKEHRGAFFDVVHARETINQLLLDYGITLDDIVEIWGTPGLETKDVFATMNEYDNLSYHSIGHLFSSLLSESNLFQNETIIGLAVDGGPDAISDKHCCEKNLYAGCVSRKGDVELFEISSPGMLWMIATNYYDLKEGTLMALETASKSTAYCIPEVDPIYQITSNSSKLLEYFTGVVSKINSLTEKDQGTLFNGFDPMFSEEENKCSMVMKEVEKMSINMMMYNIDMIMERYGLEPSETYLSLSGGYALNCISNTFLMDKYKFKGFIAPPCVNDSGLSLGIGLYAFYKFMGRFNFSLKNAYHGDKDESLDEILERGTFKDYIAEVSEFHARKVAEDIKKGVVVWFDQEAEIGPRALGHRSLLADPTSNEAKDKLNVVKQRQWWRPVAPIILEDDMNDWFEDMFESPYMLHAFKIKADKVDLIPAVSHLDSSSRVQTINKDSKEKLYDVLVAFKELTQVPIICNTSLNDRGEPIINKIEEAFNFALRKGLEVIYVNGTRIQLQNHDKYEVAKPCKRALKLMKFSEEEKESLLEIHNPYHMTKENLALYFTLSELYARYDLSDRLSARQLKLFAQRLDVSFMI